MAVSDSIDEEDPVLHEVASHWRCNMRGEENPRIPSLTIHLRNDAIGDGVGQMCPLLFYQKAMIALRSRDQQEGIRLELVSGGGKLEDLGLLDER